MACMAASPSYSNFNPSQFTVVGTTISLNPTNSYGGGGVISNKAAHTFSLNTRYTNSTAYYVWVQQSFHLWGSVTSGNVGRVGLYVDADANGSYDSVSNYVAQEGNTSTAPADWTLGGIVAPGGWFLYTNLSSGGTASAYPGGGSLAYFSTNSTGSSGGLSANVTTNNGTLSGVLKGDGGRGVAAAAGSDLQTIGGVLSNDNRALNLSNGGNVLAGTLTGNAATATKTTWTNSGSLFVDAGGSDANDGKTSQRAKFTVTNAIAQGGNFMLFLSGDLNTTNVLTLTNGPTIGYGSRIINQKGGIGGIVNGNNFNLFGVTVTNATDPFDAQVAIGATYLDFSNQFTNGVVRDFTGYGDSDVAYFNLTNPATAEFYSSRFFGKYDNFVAAGPLDFKYFQCVFSSIGPSVYGRSNVGAYQVNGFAAINSTNTFYGCDFTAMDDLYTYGFNGTGGYNVFNGCNFRCSSTNGYDVAGLLFQTYGIAILNGCNITVTGTAGNSLYAISSIDAVLYLNGVNVFPENLVILNDSGLFSSNRVYVSGGNLKPSNFSDQGNVTFLTYPWGSITNSTFTGSINTTPDSAFTLNGYKGRVRFSAGISQGWITNNVVTTNSIVVMGMNTDDATAIVPSVKPLSGLLRVDFITSPSTDPLDVSFFVLP